MVGKIITEDDESKVKYTSKESTETVNLLVESGVCVSSSEARRVVHQMPSEKLESLLSLAEIKLNLKEGGSNVS